MLSQFPLRIFSFLIYTQSVGLLGRGISPLQGRYLHTEQNKQNKSTQKHPCLEWDLTHDPSVRAGEDSSCLNPLGHCGRHVEDMEPQNLR
jgi:hypothetical protein